VLSVAVELASSDAFVSVFAQQDQQQTAVASLVPARATGVPALTLASASASASASGSASACPTANFAMLLALLAMQPAWFRKFSTAS